MTNLDLKGGGTVQDVVSQLDNLLQCEGFPVGAVSNPRVVNDWLFIDIKGGSLLWTVKVRISTEIRDRLPSVALVSPIQLLAHVSYDSVICIDDGQGLSIDTTRQSDIYAHVLRDAVRVLEKSYQDSNSGYPDFLNEFEGYFEGIPNWILARSSVEIDVVSREIYGHVENLGKGRRACWYFSEQSGSRPSEFRIGNLAHVTGLYVALDNCVFPPPPGTPVDISFLNRIIKAFGCREHKLWEKLTTRRWAGKRKLACLLISQPRPSGGRSVFGLSFYLCKGNPDQQGETKCLVVRRHTPSFMRERGGASNKYSSSHVAVIGCGSVGSEIADALASSGVGKLTLVDYDVYDVENTFRHALGKDAFGQYKVHALTDELKRKYSGLSVTPAAKYARDWLLTEVSAQLDAVVIAIGNPSADREIAKYVREMGKPMSIIVTWLEPMGLGGHVLLLSSSGPGCLDCVYRGDEMQPALHPAISFLEAGQVVSRSLTGCLGAYIPYSVLHSRKTALLATETTLEALAGQAVGPQYQYWVGGDVHAQGNGLRTSYWYTRAGATSHEEATRWLFSNPCIQCS